MTSQSASDLGRLILRGTLGIVLPDHGYNRVFGGGKIEGTARHLTDSYLEAIIPQVGCPGKRADSQPSALWGSRGAVGGDDVTNSFQCRCNGGLGGQE